MQDISWTTFLTDWRHSLVPGCFLLLAVLRHASAVIRNPLYWIWNPFRNFITLHDLPSPLEPTDKSIESKSRALTYIAVFLMFYWIGSVAFAMVGENVKLIIYCTLSTLSWVSPRDEIAAFLLNINRRILFRGASLEGLQRRHTRSSYLPSWNCSCY